MCGCSGCYYSSVLGFSAFLPPVPPVFLSRRGAPVSPLGTMKYICVCGDCCVYTLTHKPDCEGTPTSNFYHSAGIVSLEGSF